MDILNYVKNLIVNYYAVRNELAASEDKLSSLLDETDAEELESLESQYDYYMAQLGALSALTMVIEGMLNYFPDEDVQQFSSEGNLFYTIINCDIVSKNDKIFCRIYDNPTIKHDDGSDEYHLTFTMGSIPPVYDVLVCYIGEEKMVLDIENVEVQDEKCLLTCKKLDDITPCEPSKLPVAIAIHHSFGNME